LLQTHSTLITNTQHIHHKHKAH